MWVYKTQEISQKKKFKWNTQLTLQDMLKKIKDCSATKVKILALIVQLQELFVG